MTDMGTDGEFDEIDTTEEEVDAMLAQGEPVELIAGPAGRLYTVAQGTAGTYGGPSWVKTLPLMGSPSVMVTESVVLAASKAS
jgi:hypothetical protein